MDAAWPWLGVAGLGLYHGLNPAMGWLFAVALGLHRRSRAVVMTSLIPIALGHMLAIVIAAAALLVLGLIFDLDFIRTLAAFALIGWALYHLRFGSRHRVRFGMQTGFTGLFLWSFLMASGHGAGLMLVPALIPLCLSAAPTLELAASDSLLVSLAAIGIHTAAMLTVAGVIAIIIYEWVGVGVLRRGWINFDLLWTAALFGTALVLLIT